MDSRHSPNHAERPKADISEMRICKPDTDAPGALRGNLSPSNAGQLARPQIPTLTAAISQSTRLVGPAMNFTPSVEGMRATADELTKCPLPLGVAFLYCCIFIKTTSDAFLAPRTFSRNPEEQSSRSPV